MTITVHCPSCETSFPVDTDKVPDGGVNARCSVCSTIFKVDKPAAAEAVEAIGPESPEESTTTGVASTEVGIGAHEPSVKVDADGAHEDAGTVEDELEVASGAGDEFVTSWDTAADDETPAEETREVPVTPADGALEEDGAASASDLEDETPEEADWEIAPDALDEAGDFEGARDRTDFEESEADGPGIELEGGEVELASGWGEDVAEGPEPDEATGDPVASSWERDEPGATDALDAEPVDTAAAGPGVEEADVVEEAPTDEAFPTSENVEVVEPDLHASPPEADEGAVPEAVPAPSEPPTGFQFGKRDPHEKAQRLARVLVSDMIMYNPERHDRALDGGTLREDFDDEIRKSWDEYVDQVGSEMAEGTTYFSEALNDILARGERIFEGNPPN